MSPDSRPRGATSRSSAARRASGLVGLGLVIALAAGCSGGQDPAPKPPPPVASDEPSPTPTPTSTTPVKPERPAAMDQDNAEGAAAAAEYFLELSGYALASVDDSELKTMSHSSCGFCAGTLDKVNWLRSSGSSYSGGAVEASVEDPDKYVRDDQTGIFPFDADVNQETLTVLDAEGEEVASEQGYSDSVRVEVGRNAGAWVIVEVAPIPEG